MKKNRLWMLLVLGLSVVPPMAGAGSPQAEIKSIYGVVRTQDALSLELLQSSVLNRLKAIDMQGPIRYLQAVPGYSAYEHVMGVYSLLIRFNRPQREQIAGLLSGVAYTVFGDFGSFLFHVQKADPLGPQSHPPLNTFQLDTQADFFHRTGLDRVLVNHGISPQDIFPLQDVFPALSKTAPDLSAQNIERTLRMAFGYKMLTPQDIENILKDLRFEGDRWFFANEKTALRFAKVALYLADRVWGDVSRFVVNQLVADALKRAVLQRMITLNELRFGADVAVLNKLVASKDRPIIMNLQKAKTPQKFYDLVDNRRPYQIWYKPVFQGLDPYVKTGRGMERLTQLNLEFQKDFQEVRDRMINGFRVVFTKSGVQENLFSPNQFQDSENLLENKMSQ